MMIVRYFPIGFYNMHVISIANISIFFLFFSWHQQHFTDGYGVQHMVKDHHSAREETSYYHYMDYSIWLAAKDLLYTPSYRQVNTYDSICCPYHVSLAGMRNSSLGPPWGINLMTHHTVSYISHQNKCNKAHGMCHSILCYTSCGTPAGTGNSSMGPLWEIIPMTHCTKRKVTMTES